MTHTDTPPNAARSSLIELSRGRGGIEFEKGNTAIAAVRAGELDELLSQHAKASDVPKAKRAA